METVINIVSVLAIGVAFIVGLVTGRRTRPEPQTTSDASHTHVISYAAPEAITLDKPAVEPEVEAIAELVQKVYATIDASQAPPTGWNNLPYNQRIPVKVGQTTLHVEWADPYEDCDWSAKLFWNGEELLLDEDEQYDLNSSIEEWSNRVDYWADGEGRRKANELAKQILASS